MKFNRPSLLALSSFVTVFLYTGCAVHRPMKSVAPTPIVTQTPSISTHALAVWVPLSDTNATVWLKLLDLHPSLKMVVAVSPRFKHLTQDPLLRAKILALVKAGRLELALQLPNAPFLPLLMDSDSAKESLPPGTALPQPPFSYPEDVVQMVASAKSDFFHEWHTLPKGLVLPYGAVNPMLLNLLGIQGFSWTVAALQVPLNDGVYQVGPLMAWDATPSSKSKNIQTFVWDERTMKDRTAFNQWIEDVEHSGATMILPSDYSVPVPTLTSATHWPRRTWTTLDWSPWIGTPAKNAGWNSLRRTREALEQYKNSGQASLKRLDAAFEEIYTAENSNYFSALGNPLLSPQVAEDRAHEFEATLGTVYRLVGKTPPDDLFEATHASDGLSVRSSSSSAIAETLPDGTDHVRIEDPENDSKTNSRLAEPPGHWPAGSFDLRTFEIWADSTNVRFSIQLDNLPSTGLGSPGTAGPLIDVYIDLNHISNVGTLNLLPGRRLRAAAEDAWEYAVTLSAQRATVYRTLGASDSEQAGVFPLTVHGNAVEFSLPRAVLRGSPKKWGYQVLVMALDPASSADHPQPYTPASLGETTPPLYDVLDPSQETQAALFSKIASGETHELPFVRPLMSGS